MFVKYCTVPHFKLAYIFSVTSIVQHW